MFRQYSHPHGVLLLWQTIARVSSLSVPLPVIDTFPKVLYTTPSFCIPHECLCSGEDPAMIWSYLSSQVSGEILFDVLGTKHGIFLELEVIYILSWDVVEPLSELGRFKLLLIVDGIVTNCELGSLDKFGANSNHSRDPNANFSHSGAQRWMEEG